MPLKCCSSGSVCHRWARVASSIARHFRFSREARNPDFSVIFKLAIQCSFKKYCGSNKMSWSRRNCHLGISKGQLWAIIIFKAFSYLDPFLQLRWKEPVGKETVMRGMGTGRWAKSSLLSAARVPASGGAGRMNLLWEREQGRKWRQQGVCVAGEGGS